MYARIREALYSTENANVAVEEKVFNSDASILQKEHSTEDVDGELGDVELNIHGDNDAITIFSRECRSCSKANPLVRPRKKIMKKVGALRMKTWEVWN
ncbi:hypothetical protein OIU76_021175 [Salix suchowensis]|nr:hypothetical protein OIU76_021175 [Salix suchowensis]